MEAEAKAMNEGEIVNPGKHEHRFPYGGNICADCNQVVITPILSWDDERLKSLPYPVSDAILHSDGTLVFHTPEMVIEAIMSVKPRPPLDWVLMEFCDRMNWARPDYVNKVGNYYVERNADPPHVNNDSATDWWVTP
jgi:hypothetical protein